MGQHRQSHIVLLVQSPRQVLVRQCRSHRVQSDRVQRRRGEQPGRRGRRRRRDRMNTSHTGVYTVYTRQHNKKIALEHQKHYRLYSSFFLLFVQMKLL